MFSRRIWCAQRRVVGFDDGVLVVVDGVDDGGFILVGDRVGF